MEKLQSSTGLRGRGIRYRNEHGGAVEGVEGELEAQASSGGGPKSHLSRTRIADGN